MLIFFIDTHLFIHYKDLEQLDWSAVTSGEDVMLMIATPVADEIDRLKHHENSRKSRRAKKTASLFREIKNLEKIIREANPKVSICFAPDLDPDRKKPAGLDLSRSDNTIIEEALAYRENNHGAIVKFLTNDIIPQRTAARFGLDTVTIPDDWMLPPQADPRDKEIAELKRRIHLFEQNLPKIDLSVKDVSDNTIKSLTINVVKYDELSDEEIQELVDEAQRRWPMEDKFEA